MIPVARKVLKWTAIIALYVWSFDHAENKTEWAFNVAFLIPFSLGIQYTTIWAIRYSAIKRLERKGLLYVALAQERFGND